MADERVRVTVSIEPEAYEVFRRMAESAGVSVSRCMGDWLADTADAAQLATSKLVEIRRSPERVAHDYFKHQADEVVSLMQGKRLAFDTNKLGRMLKGEVSGAASAARAGKPSSGAGGAPSSNTGLKVPRAKGKHYSALNPLTGARELLLEGQYFDKSGVVKTRARG